MVKATLSLQLIVFIFAVVSLKVIAQTADCPPLDRSCKISEYTKVIAANPKDAEAYLHRGFLYQTQGELDRAIVDFTAYISLGSPTSKEMVLAFTNRAMCYSLKYSRNKAILDYTRAIELEAKDPRLFFLRGDLYKSQNSYHRAIADFTSAIALKPDYAIAFRFRGNTYLWLDDRKKAFADFNKSIELDPDDADTYLSRAREYDNRGEPLKAISDYDRFIALNARFPWTLPVAYRDRGNAYQRAGKEKEAIDDLTSAIGISPKDWSLYFYRAAIYRKQGKKALANADDLQVAKLR